jgi:hypothetical protein
VVIYLIKRKQDAVDAAISFRGQLFFIVFFFYPSVCTYCFSCFLTVQITPDVAVLIGDDRLLYEDPAHMPYRLVSTILIVAFAFGVPLGIAGLLFNVHRQTKPVDVTLKASVSQAFHISMDEADGVVNDIVIGSNYGFLTDAFKPKYFMAESLDMLRKLFLVGLLVFVRRGSVAQTMTGSFVALAFVCWHIRAWPYKLDADNKLRAAIEIHTCLTIAVALAFRTELDSTMGSFFGTEADGAFRLYSLDIASRRKPYDWLLVSTFIICVPGMFFLTIAQKVRMVQQSLKQVADAAEAHGDTPTRMRFTFSRFRLGLATGQDTKDLADYITHHLALENEHQRAGMQLWRDMQVVSHLKQDELSSVLQTMEEELPKSHSLGYHFTDVDSARLILGSLGIRASTVGQLGGARASLSVQFSCVTGDKLGTTIEKLTTCVCAGGVSIALASPVDLGWDRLGPAAFHQGCGVALWGKSPFVFAFSCSTLSKKCYPAKSKLFCTQSMEFQTRLCETR